MSDSKPTKILVITDSIDAEDSSGSKANVAFIKSLVISGFETTVLHYTQQKLTIDGAACVCIRENRKTVNYILGGFQRVIQRTFKVNWSAVLENRFGFSFTYFNDCNSIAKTLGTYNSEDFNLLITLSKGESFRPHYTLLDHTNWHSKWLAYVHDPYPFQNYPEPYRFIPKGAAQKHHFFKKVATNCRFAGFPSQYLADHMTTIYSDFSAKQVIIPHQYDSSFKIIELPSFFNKEFFNLVHTGNLIGGRSPEGLLKGFKSFLNANPEAKGRFFLYLIGPSGNYSKLFSDFSEIKEFISLPSVPYAEALALQTHATVNLIIEASDTAFSPFLPAKMPHAVYADKPIVALSPNISEVRRLLGLEYKWQSKAYDVEHISKILSQLFNIWKSDPTSGLALNRPDLQAYFSAGYLAQKISKLIEDAA